MSALITIQDLIQPADLPQAVDAGQPPKTFPCDLKPGELFGLREYQQEPTASDYPAADYYLKAVRQLSASSGVSQFNALMLNPDYRQRFLEAFPDGRHDGLVAALGEIVTEIDGTLQAVYLAAEAIAEDPGLGTDLLTATAFLWLRPGLRLSDSENRQMDAKLAQIQKRLFPGFAQRPDIATMPLDGFRQSTRRMMQAVSSLRVWRDAITAPSKMSLGLAALDAVFQSSQDWSDIFVGTEEDFAMLFATTTEGLIQMNCDPVGQGYNLGWVAGYIAIWVATIVVFEALIGLESPI
jgi:hypothetical protein